MRIRKFREEDAGKVSYLICKAVKEVLSKAYPQDVIDYVLLKHTPEKVLERSKKWDVYVVVEGNDILGTGNLREDRLY
ncbi:MAG: hypothetical protein AB1295_00060 [Candidatus Micrarchaeota archaeon]